MALTTLDITVSKESGTPLYKGLKAKLAKLIQSGQLDPGQRFYSYRRIAEASGVSRITAQMAIKELIKDGLLKRVPQKRAVVATPKQAEASSAVTWTVGVVLSHWDCEGAMAWNDGKIFPAMLDRAAERGVALQMVSHITAVAEDTNTFDRLVKGSSFDGLFWLSMRADTAVTASRWAGMGLVQVAVQNRPSNLPVPLVIEDNHAAGCLAARQVLAAGHDQVLVVHGSPQIGTYRQRLTGIRDTLADHGKAWSAGNFLDLPESSLSAWIPIALRDSLARVKPTAILHVGASLLALAHAAEELGLSLGEDIDVISFSPPEAELRPIAFPYRYFMPRLPEIGRHAVDLWLDSIRASQTGKPDWENVVRTIPMDLKEHNP